MKKNYLTVRVTGIHYVQHNYYTLLSHANLLYDLHFLYLTIFTISFLYRYRIIYVYS